MYVIYKIDTFEIVKVVKDKVDIATLPEDEDFIPLEVWNDCSDKEKFPKIEIPFEGIIGNTSMAKMVDETIHPKKYKKYLLTPKESFPPICDAININVKTINLIINSLKDEEVILLYDIMQGRVSNILNK